MKRNQNTFDIKRVCFVCYCWIFAAPVSTDVEVAVLIGGMDNNGTHLEVEVWNYINHHKQNCSDSGEPPHVPDFPFPVKGASAAYLPDIGIYVCGGVNETSGDKSRDCYKYNPRESRR